MPFRHLLYHRREGPPGPPKRPHESEEVLDQTSHFYQPSQNFAQPQWSDVQLTCFADPTANMSPMNEESASPYKRQALDMEESYGHDRQYFGYNHFQQLYSEPFSIDSENCYNTQRMHYANMMDAEVSSLSQGSVYSSVISSFPSSRKHSSSSDQQSRRNSDRMCAPTSSPCEADSHKIQFASMIPIEEFTPTNYGIMPAAPQEMNVIAGHSQMMMNIRDSANHAIDNQPTQPPKSTKVADKKSKKGSAERRKIQTRQRRNAVSITPAVSVSKPSFSSSHIGITTAEQTQKSRARQAHSLVEKKYRENLNAKIMQLHQTLQHTQFGIRVMNGNERGQVKVDGGEDEEEDDDDNLKSPTTNHNKVKKSDVLTEAMNYVNASEVEIRHMAEEIQRLNEKVQNLEKLVKCEDCGLSKQMITLKLQRPR